MLVIIQEILLIKFLLLIFFLAEGNLNSSLSNMNSESVMLNLKNDIMKKFEKG